jgi:hypothetical protein
MLPPEVALTSSKCRSETRRGCPYKWIGVASCYQAIRKRNRGLGGNRGPLFRDRADFVNSAKLGWAYGRSCMERDPFTGRDRGNLSRIGDCGTSGADRLISETCLTAVGGADRQTVGSPPKPTRNFLAGRRRLPDTVGARFSSPSDGGDGRRCGGEAFTETRRRKGRKKTYWKCNATCEKGTRGPSFPP